MSCWMCVTGIRLWTEQFFGVTGRARAVIKTGCQMGPSCAVKQLSCWDSLLSFLLFQSMVWTIEGPGSHLFHFLLNLAFKLKRSMNFVVEFCRNWDTKMQCNDLALKWTLCCFPYLQTEKANWECQPINLNIRVLMSHFSAPPFRRWGSSKVPYYHELAANSCEVQILQTNNAYTNRWHMLPSV